MTLFWEDELIARRKTKEKIIKEVVARTDNWRPPEYKKIQTKVPTVATPKNQTPQAVLDIECYSNYFLVMFMRLSDNKPVAFDMYEGKDLAVDKIKDIMEKYEIITFNGNHYDIPMLERALNGATCNTLKLASDEIIAGLTTYKFYLKHNIVEPKYNHIDIIELCIGQGSLKTYGGRLHCEKLQDLPLEESSLIDKEQRTLLKEYCHNDLLVTSLLFQKITPQINLRRLMSSKYNVDLRSKSDAQIAETVIKAEVKRLTERHSPKNTEKITEFKYDVPDFIDFETDKMDKVLEILQEKSFVIRDTGKIDMPKELADMRITIGKSTYQMGMGGLHSTEKSCYHLEDDDYIIADFDVTSYYPSIILNCKLYPKQLGTEFLTIYKDIVEERIIAKEIDKIKADTLKIVVNGSFGKLGSPYSALYSPKLMIQVTVTGQMSLLMLIDSLEARGIKVVSGNTDGIVIKCQRNKEKVMLALIKDWEEQTGFNMERTDYSAIYSRDVNNYLAIKHNGAVKTKGCFSDANLAKNPNNDICNEAVIDFLANGNAIEAVVYSCTDIRKFLTLRNVKGGAIKNKYYLGKVIRWYYSTETKGNIQYKNNGNSVPMSFGAKPLMQIPETFPSDVDYDYYITECYNILKNLGIAIAQ